MSLRPSNSRKFVASFLLSIFLFIYAEKTFHKHPESRGIGLFMIKNQIEAMGGEITIESQENIGTTFYINFNKHHTNED